MNNENNKKQKTVNLSPVFALTHDRNLLLFVIFVPIFLTHSLSLAPSRRKNLQTHENFIVSCFILGVFFTQSMYTAMSC